LAGRLTFTLSAPRDAGAAVVAFHWPEGREEIRVNPGTERAVDLTLCSAGEWRALYEATYTGTVGDRLVSVQASEPVFRPDPRACS
jgi:hypothetical protein